MKFTILVQYIKDGLLHRGTATLEGEDIVKLQQKVRIFHEELEKRVNVKVEIFYDKQSLST